MKHIQDIQLALKKETINGYINFKISAISIEVPNRESGIIGLKALLTSSSFINAKSTGLTFALGKNLEGECICPDITKMPHLLVAGTTGSGKSFCLNSMIISLLYKYGPQDLRFILVDPKQVEFTTYDKLPHLMINEIIFDIDKTLSALNWAIREMENRYNQFKQLTESGLTTRNITEYNQNIGKGEEKMSKIVIIIDEFGDLMLQAKKELETKIIRLVQKARACGIHLVMATQRPSVDCITGLIKSNLPARIGLKTNSYKDSCTIFDVGGAEKLLGNGDMYFKRPDSTELIRVQGTFIDSSEIQKVTDFIKQNNETFFDEAMSEYINASSHTTQGESGGEFVADTQVDGLYIKALEFCIKNNKASVAMLQRGLGIDYQKSCKIIDWMTNMNYVTQVDGSRPRNLLITAEDFRDIYGEMDD